MATIAVFRIALLSLIVSFSIISNGLPLQDTEPNGHDLVHSDPDSALILFRQDLATSDSLNYVRALNGIGNAYQFKAMFDSAVSTYLLAQTIAERRGYTKEIGVVQNNLGSLYLGYNQLDKASKNLEQALVIFEGLEDTVWMTRAIVNLAGIDFMNGLYAKSLQRLRYTAVLSRRIGNQQTEGGAYANASMVHRVTGNIDSAMVYMDKGVDLLLAQNDKRGMVLALKEKANILTEANRVDHALQTYEEMRSLAQEMNHPAGVYDSYFFQAQLEEKEGRSMEAFEHMKLALVWKDSVLTQRELELAGQYESEKKDADIALLVKENQLRESQQRTLLAVFIGVVAVLLLSVYLYWQIRKANHRLKAKNEIISDALKTNDLLMKEIHHRVKNNLQIVSSLLSIQTNFLEDKKSRQAVESIQSRVISMAMVHKNLYSGSRATHVLSDQYLENLIESLRSSLQDEDHPVEIVTDVESVEISADQAVNLGLITNEIITNAIKHAFRTESDGRRKIEVFMNQAKEELTLKIKDNGIGMELPSEEVKLKSYGWQMIESLIRSMHGSVTLVTDGGTCVELKIPTSL